MSYWAKDWKGRSVIVVASGPSAIEAPLEMVRGVLPVVVVNESWKLAPWADILYGCDDRWWLFHDGVPEFKGLKVTSNHRCASQFPELLRVRLDGNNSGIRAVRLAVLYGARRVVLVGFDMHAGNGSHWHGDHPVELRTATPEKMNVWRKEMEAAARKFTEQNVEILNTSKASALLNYVYVPFLEAVSHAHHDAHSVDRQRHQPAAQ